MSIRSIGGWLIGIVLLATGVAVLASDIDPSALCFKQCEVPRLVVHLVGSSTSRLLIGLFLVLLGGAFVVPQLMKSREGQAHER